MKNPTTQRLAYRINEAEAKLGISRSTIYRLVAAKRLKLVKLGARASGITADSIHAMIGDTEPAGSCGNATATKSGS